MQIIAYFVLFCHYGDFVENLFSSPKRRCQRQRQSRCLGAFFCFFLLTSTVTSVIACLSASAENLRTAGIWGFFPAYQRRSLTSKHFFSCFFLQFPHFPRQNSPHRTKTLYAFSSLQIGSKSDFYASPCQSPTSLPKALTEADRRQPFPLIFLPSTAASTPETHSARFADFL